MSSLVMTETTKRRLKAISIPQRVAGTRGRPYRGPAYWLPMIHRAGSVKQLAVVLGVAYTTLQRWIETYDAELRGHISPKDSVQTFRLTARSHVAVTAQLLGVDDPIKLGLATVRPCPACGGTKRIKCAACAGKGRRKPRADEAADLPIEDRLFGTIECGECEPPEGGASTGYLECDVCAEHAFRRPAP